MKFVALILAVIVLALAGCASYTTQQDDFSFSGTNIVRRVSTRVTIRTVLAASSELSKSSVTMSDKNQSSKIGSVTQFATNNIPDVVEKAAKGIIEGAKAFP